MQEFFFSPSEKDLQDFGLLWVSDWVSEWITRSRQSTDKLYLPIEAFQELTLSHQIDI